MTAGKGIDREASEAARRITGQLWCAYGRHYVAADRFVKRGSRACCQRCDASLAAKAAASRGGKVWPRA